MLSYLKEISFVKLIFPFCLGIVGFVFLPVRPSTEVGYMLFTACVCFFLLANWTNWLNRSHQLNWLAGISVYFTFFLAGYLCCQGSTEIINAKHFSKFTNKDSRLLLEITEPLSEKEKSYNTIARVIYVVNGEYGVKTIGNVQIYLRKDSAVAHLKYGDRIWVKNSFSEFTLPKNPHEFNYKRFMGFRQIYHQAFFDSDDWMLSGEKGGYYLYARVLDLRGYLLSILRKYITDEDAFAVASSLILGLREKLDDELIKAYSSSGAMHVLSVSGLHVAIIYVIFSKMFFFLNYHSKSKIAKSLILIFIIWLYAALTGLSPSVLRSAVMFSFVAFSSNMKRTTNIYNMLAGSAFTLLLYNPYLLMEVGFQLSYLAVVGIVMFQPKIYPLLYTRWWILDQIWNITAVSIAAQIATFPLGLLYYYQFPLYFLVSNLFVIPVSTIILYLGVALFFVSWIPWLSDTIGFLLNWFQIFMNDVILYIDSLPYALLQGISISVPESWLIYVFTIGFMVFLYWKRNYFLVTALVSITILFAWNIFKIIQHQDQQKLIVYSVPKSTAIDFISGTDHLFIADSFLLNDYNSMLFHIKHNWWDSGLKSRTAVVSTDFDLPFVKRAGEYVQFLDTRVVMLDKPLDEKLPVEKLRVDFIVLSKNAKVKIESLSKFYNFSKIIFDSSNSIKKVKYWKQDCERLGLKYYDVSESGAFVENV